MNRNLSDVSNDALDDMIKNTRGSSDNALYVKLLREFNIRKGFGYKKDLKLPGAKDDGEKPDLDLVLGGFAEALQLVGGVGTFGAKKYTDYGFLTVENGVRRYSSAMLRHYFKESEGEYLDSEMELPHAACVAWNALARLQLILLQQNK